MYDCGLKSSYDDIIYAADHILTNEIQVLKHWKKVRACKGDYIKN